MTMVIKDWWVRRTPEHPRKISELRTSVTHLSWLPGERRASISAIFNEIDKLAEFELKYYYRRRNTRALISAITRFGGWVIGAAGLLLPLIAATDPSRKDLASWGYVALAAAGSCFGANALFGGTSGHASFVAAQLAIEKLVVESRVAWAKLLAETQPQSGDPTELTVEHLAAMFDLIQHYAAAVYMITATETEEWQKSVLVESTKAASVIDR